MTAFLMTWKEDQWPHENILRMLEEFRSKGSIVEPWRIAAHKKSFSGAKVWLLKQGKGKKGIFGAGEVVGAPHRALIEDGNERNMVEVRFDLLTDPLREYLIDETDVRKVLSDIQIATQSSGITITDEQSSQLANKLAPTVKLVDKLDPHTADEESFDPESVTDARKQVLRSITQRRGQRSFREALLEAYGRRCAITACPIVDILEAAHIMPYLGPKTNHVSNGLLLRTDIHTLFDCGLLGVSPQDYTVVVAGVLIGTTYEKVRDRKLRKPSSDALAPNKKALEIHLKENGLSPTAGSSASPD